MTIGSILPKSIRPGDDSLPDVRRCVKTVSRRCQETQTLMHKVVCISNIYA